MVLATLDILLIINVNVLGNFKLFTLDLLLKTHLLVPNIWLYDLVFKIYGPTSLRFGDFFVRKSDTEVIPRIFSPLLKHFLNHSVLLYIILFYTSWASFLYLIHACGCLRSPEIPKISYNYF